MSKIAYNENFQIRKATREDVPLIFSFIKELAEYEKMSNDVIATEEILEEWIFNKNHAEALIGEYEGVPVGFALYFYNFSTFIGRAGLYIEDIYIKPEMRGKGFGKTFFHTLTRIALELGCGRMEWSCLDWNKPSIDFYRSMGAIPMEEWTVYRLTEEAMQKLIDTSNQK